MLLTKALHPLNICGKGFIFQVTLYFQQKVLNKFKN